MRVLILTQYYLPQPLANAEVVGGLAEGLAARGHDIEVVTAAPGARSSAAVGVRRALGYYPEDRASVPRRVLEYLAFSLGALASGATARRPDVVVVPSPPPTLGAVGMVVAALRRRPLVYVVEDLYPEVAIATGAVRPGPALALLGRLMRLVYRRSAAVVVIDPGLVGAIGAVAPGARVRPIRNGIDLAPFAGAARDDGWLRSLGIDPDRPVVMYAGNVGRSQDLATVARAAAACGAQLVVHGGGAALEGLRREARERGWDHVRFSGFVDRERLGAVFASADLHVVPLKPDISSASVPSKLLSIFGAGRPALVAAEADSAAARLLGESGAGWLVDAGDEPAMTAAMGAALSDPAELDRRGGLGRRWAVANAGNDRCAAEYEALLLEGVGGGPPAR